MLPREPYCAVSRAAMTFLGDAVMDLLTEDAIPAYNMCAPLFGPYSLLRAPVAPPCPNEGLLLALVSTCPDRIYTKHACLHS